MVELHNMFLENGWYEIIRDDRRLNSYLRTTSNHDLKKLLIFFNSKIRNIPESAKGLYSGQLYASSLVAPSKYVKRRILDKGLNALKLLKSRKEKGALMYYLLNELHLFEDGNGRTARLIYTLLSDRNVDLRDTSSFSHDEDDVAITYYGSFEKQAQLISTQAVSNFSSLVLRNNIVTADRLPKEILDFKFIKTYGSGAWIHNDAYITDEIKRNLSAAELLQVNNALTDNDTSFSVSGLTILIMGKLKGCFDEYIQMGKIGEGFSLSVSTNESEWMGQNPELVFSNWTKEDYLKAAKIASTLKESMLEVMIDFFVLPDKYKWDEKTTLANYLTGENSSPGEGIGEDRM